MIKYMNPLLLFVCFYCQSIVTHSKDHNKVNESTCIEDHVAIEVFTYEQEGETKASSMPKIRPDSELIEYQKRFEYLLINVSRIHRPEFAAKRNEIWSLYPDTVKLKKRYLNEYVKDQVLTRYFETSCSAIIDTNFKVSMSFNQDELMEVASKFFYCDKVLPDTTVQSHVCVGLNGVSEANWSKDYTLLEAFCYEGIFTDLLQETSELEKVYSSHKEDACNKYKFEITTLDHYLMDVRKELFASMKNDDVLNSILMKYYIKNADKLAFQIKN